MPVLYNRPVLYHQYNRSGYLTNANAFVDYFSSGGSRQLQAGLSPLLSDFRYVESDPSYKIKIAKRQDATRTYAIYGVSYDLQALKGWGSDPSVDVKYSDSSTMFADVASTPSFLTDDPALSGLALTRLKRKLKRHIGSFDSLVPLAEIRDLRTTVKGLAELTTSLVKELIDIKRTRGRSAGRYASKAWLTYGFGLRPMIADADAICKSIVKYLERTDHSVRLAGSASRDWFSYGTNGAITSNRLGAYNNRWQMHHTLSYRYLALFYLPLRSSNSYGTSDHFGIGFPELIPAFWEATAFSWVVDYFTNVGEFLDDAFTSPPGDTIYVLKNTRLDIAGVADSYHTPSKFLSSSGGRMSFKFSLFTREPLGTQLPRVGLRVRSVDEIGKYGVSKLLNLVSILGTGLKTRY